MLATDPVRVPIAAAALLFLPAVASARWVLDTPSRFYFSGALGSGCAIEIKGVVGDVVAEPSSNGEVEVVAVKQSDADGDPAKVRVEVVDHAGGTTVRAVYLEADPGTVAVHFRVRVPPGVRFVGHTANGKVAAWRLRGPVEAHTVNGDIDIHTSGEAVADTVNGSITARLEAASAPATLRTVNGNVTVKIPVAAALDFDAHTVNGAITASLPLARAQDTFQHVSGILGRGGSRLDLRTVNGDIVLQPLHRGILQ